MHSVNEYPVSGSSIIKVCLLIKYLIYFKVAFNQDSLTSSSNMVTSAKVLGSGMKCDTYGPASPKVSNILFDSFTTSLNTSCKPFPVLFDESYFPFHSLFVCLIWSRILNIAYITLMSGCIWLPSQMSLRAFVLISPSS